MDSVSYFVHDFDPFLIRFYGKLGIRYYGLAYALGFAIALWLFRRLYQRGRSPLNTDQQMVAMFALFLGVVIGGRLGHVLLYDLSEFLHDPLVFFRFFDGGMASHGGFAGVIIACVWIAHRYRMSFFRLADILAVLTPAGLMLGRIANFINGELWGTVSYVPWAVIFPRSAPSGTPLSEIPPRHPSQLYEAALEGALLLAYTQWRMMKTDAYKHPGRIAGEFAIGYAIVRIIGEQFRAPDSPPVWGIQRGIFYSFFLALFGAFLLYRSFRQKTQPEPAHAKRRLK